MADTSSIEQIVAVAATGATKFLRGLREAITVQEREYSADEVVAWVAGTIDGSRSQDLSAEVRAESSGGELIVTVIFRDPVFGRPVPEGKVFRFVPRVVEPD